MGFWSLYDKTMPVNITTMPFYDSRHLFIALRIIPIITLSNNSIPFTPLQLTVTNFKMFQIHLNSVFVPLKTDCFIFKIYINGFVADAQPA